MEIAIDKITGLNDNKHLRQEVYDYLAQSGLPAVHIEADFFNLGQLNNALGRDLTNKLLQIGSTLYTQELKNAGADIIYGHRDGGDEVTFLIGGIDAATAAQATDKADQRIAELARQTSLYLLRHHKRPAQSGFALNSTLEDIHPDQDFTARRDALQHETSTDKLTPHESNTQHFVEPEYFQPAAKRAHMEALFDEVLAPFAHVALTTLPQDDRFTNLQDFQSVRETRRTRIEALAAQTDGNASLMRVDLMNMGGLNDNVGKDFTDHILDKIKMIIAESCAESGLETDIFAVSGGMVDIAIKTQDTQALDRLKISITERAKQEIFSKSAGDYARDNGLTAPAQNADTPLHRIYDTREQRHATGIVTEAIALSPDRSASEHLQRLDSAAEVLKFHGLSCITDSSSTGIKDRISRHFSRLGLSSLRSLWQKSADSNAAQADTPKKDYIDLHAIDTDARHTQIAKTPIDQDTAPSLATPLPYGRSLSDRLTPDILMAAVDKGARTFHALVDGVFIDDEAVARYEASEFDERLYKRLKQVSDCAELLRMARTQQDALENGQAFVPREDSLLFLKHAVDIGKTSRKFSSLYDMELYNQLALVSIHAANLSRSPTSPHTAEIIASRAASALDDQIKRNKNECLKSCLRDLKDDLLSGMSVNIDMEGAYYMLFRDMEHYRLTLAETQELPADDFVIINGNINAMGKITVDQGDVFGREQMEMLAARHKRWLESDGAQGERLVLENVKSKSGLERFVDTPTRNPLLDYDFSHAIIKSCGLTKNDFENAKFEGASIEDTNFDCGNLTGADFRNVEKLDRCWFWFCGMAESKFTVSQDIMTCFWPVNEEESMRKMFTGRINGEDRFSRNDPAARHAAQRHLDDLNENYAREFKAAYKTIEFYMPSGERVYGFYADKEGQLLFTPDEDDRALNSAAGINEDDVHALIGDALPVRAFREAQRQERAAAKAQAAAPQPV